MRGLVVGGVELERQARGPSCGLLLGFLRDLGEVNNVCTSMAGEEDSGGSELMIIISFNTENVKVVGYSRLAAEGTCSGLEQDVYK